MLVMAGMKKEQAKAVQKRIIRNKRAKNKRTIFFHPFLILAEHGVREKYSESENKTAV